MSRYPEQQRGQQRTFRHTPATRGRYGALFAVAGLISDASIPERFRAVVYVNAPNDESSRPLVDLLEGYLSARYWVHKGAYFDSGAHVPAAERPGLLAAVDRVKTGDADAIVMAVSDYDELSVASRAWLELEVQRFGGFISEIATSTDSEPS